MAPLTSQNADSSSSSSLHDSPENSLQPFFVLHRGCISSASSARPKSRRKLNEEAVHEFSDLYLNNLKINAFHSVWSNIESTVKDVLWKNNISVFNDVNSWVHNSFNSVRSCAEPGFAQATQPYPIVIGAFSKQIFTGLVYTKNMEFVDDHLTFEELGKHLKSCGIHVANMSSLDFSAKNGISGCLNCLLRKFLTVTLDDADLSILASWYCGQRECMPVVIIIEDMERCCASVLSDFILMLSNWVVKIPVILVMGVTTTSDALQSVLSSNALLCLRACTFILGSPAQRMDDIVEAVLLRSCLNFHVGHKVALFMRDYFRKHDGTLTSFIRALKIACMQHFCSEPLSFLLKDLDTVTDFQEIWKDKHAFMQDMVLKHSSQFHSCRSEKVGEPTCENLIDAIKEMKKIHQRWAITVMCLNEVGKLLNVPLLDLYNEALDPDMHGSRNSYDEGKSSFRNGCFSSQHGGPSKRTSISNAVHKVR
ncbi:Origin of replication complex subunit 3 [Bienertia sinuspersici]